MDEYPDYLLEAIRAVRETGRVNMYDRRGVAAVADDLDLYAAADWISSHKGEYLAALHAAFEGE